MSKRVLACVVMCLTMVCAQGMSFGAISNDEVTSAKIREATSGSTSQDTNSGNGIKTGHIVDTAVTSAKIANGAVTAAKLADGVVTDAKIAGAISASKVGTYANTYVIHKGTANNVTTFNGIMACINYLTSNSTNWTGERVVIKVMPGRYASEDFSALANSTQLNVDIIGTSRESVIIVPTGGDTHLPSGTNLRSLTFEGNINIDHTVDAGIYDAKLIQATAYNGHVVSAGWQGIKNFTMDNVEIVTWEAAIGLWGNQYNDTNVFRNLKIVAMTPNNSGHIAIVYPSATPYKFSNISFHGQGGTCFLFVQNTNTTINLDNIKVEGEYLYGISIWQGSNNLNVNVANSRLNVQTLISGDSASITTTFNNTYISSLANIIGSVKINNSQINGAIPSSNGMLKIVNSIDSNYDPIANGQY